MVADQLSPRWDEPSGSGRSSQNGWYSDALTPNIFLPSQSDGPITARGEMENWLPNLLFPRRHRRPPRGRVFKAPMARHDQPQLRQLSGSRKLCQRFCLVGPVVERANAR